MLTRIPELAIEESEARSMAEAVTRVSRHYPALDNISEKAIDHANLAVVLCGIYGTRIAAYSMRRTTEKAKPVQPTNINIVTPDFGGMNAG